MMSKRLNVWILACAVMILDRITKFIALSACVKRVDLFKYCACELVFNRGISWGMLHADSSIIFSAVTVVIIMVTIFLGASAYRRMQTSKSIVPEMLIIAGSCSNIIDRFLYGGVIDFILLHIGEWYFPLFNMADVAIVVGVLLFSVRIWHE